MIKFFYCLWIGLQDGLMLLAMWGGCSLLLWAGEEYRAYREAKNPSPEDPLDGL